MNKQRLAAVALASLVATGASAAPIGPTSITNGGLTFANFDCVSNSPGLANDGCSGLNVRSFGGNGVELFGVLNAASAPGSSPSTQDVLFSYQVTSLAAPLTGVDLVFNGAVTGPGIGFADVQGSVFGDAGRSSLLGTFGVSTVSTASSTLIFSEAMNTAFAVKNILLQTYASLAGLTTATISFAAQTWLTGGGTPGTPVVVPEPASMAIFGMGLLGLVLVRRRKRG